MSKAEDLIDEAARLIAPSEGEAVFYIRVGGEYSQLTTHANGIKPQRALSLAMDLLRAESKATAACPYHIASQAGETR